MNQIQESPDALALQISGLNSTTVSDAVKNLSIAMQYAWQHPLSDDQARQALAEAALSGEAAVLRQSMLSDRQASPDDMERWGKAVLLFAGSDPGLRPVVEEAVDDAIHSRAKDFGLSALIVLGTVVVLLKYRPTTLEFADGKVNITWIENDVSIIKDLAKGVASGTGMNADAE